MTLLIIFHIKSKGKTHEGVGLSQCSRYAQPVAQTNLLLRFVPLALLITFTFEFHILTFRFLELQSLGSHSSSLRLSLTSFIWRLETPSKGIFQSANFVHVLDAARWPPPPSFWTASSSSKEDGRDLLMLLHNEMRVLHACLCGYFRERWWGKQSWQIFPDFINELCRRPQGTKGQKILSVNWTLRGAEEKGWEEELWSRKLALALTSLTTPRVPCTVCLFRLYIRGEQGGWAPDFLCVVVCGWSFQNGSCSQSRKWENKEITPTQTTGSCV